MIPYDNFRPGNVEKAEQYLRAIARVAPHRLKFTDVKHFCGSDLFLRANPLTAEVPPIATDSYANAHLAAYATVLKCSKP
jgi:hypothetical protein